MNASKNMVKFARLKKLLASVLCSDSVGYCLGVLYRNRLPFRGVTVDVRDAPVENATKARLFFGMYESAECRFVAKYLRPELNTVELGASIGAISCQILRRLNAGTWYCCVEANPCLIKTLKKNVDNNGSHVKTKVYHAAVAYKSKTVSFGVSSDNRVSSLNGEGSNAAVTVDAVTLGSIVPEGDYQLVCDIEGAEAELLSEDGSILRQCRVLIIELHEATQDGKCVTVNELAHQCETLDFCKIDQYGSVFVFGRE